VCHDRGNEPDRVRGESLRGQMGQGAVFEVGIDLFDDGVLAVGLSAAEVSRTLACMVTKNAWCRWVSNRVS
jgi:hypothetical protein